MGVLDDGFYVSGADRLTDRQQRCARFVAEFGSRPGPSTDAVNLLGMPVKQAARSLGLHWPVVPCTICVLFSKEEIRESIMTLQSIAIILGALSFAGGLVGVFRPDLINRFAQLFPRSVAPAWIFTGLCCWLGAKETLGMHMGALDALKKYIYIISPAVFVACVVYMKELLAPRALGGFLLLIAVPILQIARWHESALRLVVVALVYLWIVYGMILLFSPWYFRKIYKPFLENEALFRATALAKTAFGIVLLLLGFFAF